VFGVARAFAGVELAGRTDPLIVRDALTRHGTVPSQRLPEFRERYFVRLAEQMRSGAPAARALPGVRALLHRLHRRGDTVLGLLTGNFEPSARLKLEPFGLWHYFQCGAFGDDAPDRNGLVPVALGRAAACGHQGLTAERTIVIGDTPHDVACATVHGARSLAVATGGFTMDVLRDAGAEGVLNDFSDTAAAIALIDELSRECPRDSEMAEAPGSRTQPSRE
jgi:phosphoglycolate phosphatase-like HAD superfamily hydrolase